MEIPRHWRLRKQRYQLLGESCPYCGAKNFPGRPFCPHCQEAENLNLRNSHYAIPAELAEIRQTV